MRSASMKRYRIAINKPKQNTMTIIKITGLRAIGEEAIAGSTVRIPAKKAEVELNNPVKSVASTPNFTTLLAALLFGIISFLAMMGPCKFNSQYDYRV